MKRLTFSILVIPVKTQLPNQHGLIEYANVPPLNTWSTNLEGWPSVLIHKDQGYSSQDGN